MSKPTALSTAELKRHPLPAVASGDKDRHGQLLIVAGSREVPGAALLAGEAAMRAGAGKLQLAVPEDIAIPIGLALPFAKVMGFPAARDGGFAREAVKQVISAAEGAHAVIAGPGMTANRSTEQLAAALCDLGKPLALDAALLHALPEAVADARKARVSPLLLPHSGEMASLLGCSPEDVEANPLECGRRCAKRYGAVVLVKGVQSHIVAPDGRAWLYRGGAPGLGVSGSGDTLAGIAGGLLARGADPLTACLWSVWLHGEAGRRLSKKIGRIGFLASEIPGEVPALLGG